MMLMWTEIGIFAATLLWVAALVKVSRRWLPRKALVVVLLAGLAAGMVPINNLVIGSYIFSLVSYLSIASILLLVLSLVASFVGSRAEKFKLGGVSAQQRLVIAVFFVLGGVILYPLAGGLTMFDSYRLGFSGAAYSPLLVVYLFGWASLCVFKRWYLLLTLILVSVLAYYLEVLPSLNLWDYLIDPLVVVYSLFSLLKYGACRLFSRQALN